MFYFTYWLEHFKEFSNAKTQGIIKKLIQLSGICENDCSHICKLIDCTTLSNYRRIRQIVMDKYNEKLSQSDKRALALFGDYLEFREYSSYQFPKKENSALIKYCETMSMSYSYKAVLILVLVQCTEATNVVDLNYLCKKFCAFYSERINNNLPAEKSNSIFAQNIYDEEMAKKTIINNPIKVLNEAGIIILDQKSNNISFSSEYSVGDKEDRLKVIEICSTRIQKYYSANNLDSSTEAEIYNQDKKVISALNNMKNIIMNVENAEERKSLIDSFNALQRLLLYKDIDHKDHDVNVSKLDYNDERKIGIIVQACFLELETAGYPFSQKQIENLTSLEWSKANFKKLYYPVLKEFDETKAIDQQRIDNRGNSRYYEHIFTYVDKKYLLTSQWYKDAKSQFITWYNSLN